MTPLETIAAIATPPGRGAVAIVRVSGPLVRSLAARLVRSDVGLQPHRAIQAEILDGQGMLLDRGIAIFAAAPRSYTGEDTLELHIHGSPVLARETLRALLECGARLAGPGEFTRRAYVNGKLELSAAEAVADLIGAETRGGARAALANLAGGLSAAVRALRGDLRSILEELAGAIDFPDEIPDPEVSALLARLGELETALNRLRRSGEVGRLAREGAAVAIVGPPNAGKSSLLNALLGEERALVSDLPGTTRDTIEESIEIDGVPIRLVDTAGIREHTDRLELAGIARTMRALETARIALVVLDGSQPLDPLAREVLARTAGRERVLFCNKADLGDAGARELRSDQPVVGSVYDSRTLRSLRDAIARIGWGAEPLDLEQPYYASGRELDAINDAFASVTHGRATLASGEPVDLIAGDLQRAFAALGHVSGDIAAEELLESIFARFCIGK